MKLTALLYFTTVAYASLLPQRRDPSLLQNGQDAIAMNQRFATLTSDSSCTPGETACVQNSYAICDEGKYVLSPCGSDQICAAVPSLFLGSGPGVVVACTTEQDRDERIMQSGATLPSVSSSSFASSVPSGTPGADAQSSRTLLDSVVASGFADDGQTPVEPGQSPSMTSTNNFINFCATVPHLPLTNGQQIANGSCNPAPMGIIAAATNIPTAKFQYPTNGAVIEPKTTFTVEVLVSHMETGWFTNAQKTFMSAPQTVNDAGDIRGHLHVVIEKLTAIDQTTPTNPGQFSYFRGLNNPAVNGVLVGDVSQGLDEGVYRISTITTASNHQPVLVAVAQHGSVEDVIYFTVRQGGSLVKRQPFWEV